MKCSFNLWPGARKVSLVGSYTLALKGACSHTSVEAMLVMFGEEDYCGWLSRKSLGIVLKYEYRSCVRRSMDLDDEELRV